MLELRAELPDEFEAEEGLTTAGRETMLLLQALLEKYNITNFQVVRIKK